jgi:hypothetical protein
MSRIAFASFALAASLVTGCIIHNDGGDDTGDGSGSGHGSGSGSGSGTVSPAAGRWFYEETTPVSSTCPMSFTRGEGGDFAIDTVTTTSFRVVPADSTDPFTCTLDGKDFNCPDRAVFTESYPNAVVTAHATATGLFSAGDRANGHQDANVTCVGTGCSALGGALPCAFKVHFTIQAY